jgi:hypothetical protein
MAPTYVLAYNTGDSPIVVDSSGRTIGGHEWAPARRGAVLDAAGNNGSIVVLTKVDVDTAGPDAERAARQAEELNTRAGRWEGLDLDLVRDVGRAQLDAAAAELDRVDLVDLLVRNGIDPPPTTADAVADAVAGPAEAPAPTLAAPAAASGRHNPDRGLTAHAPRQLVRIRHPLRPGPAPDRRRSATFFVVGQTERGGTWVPGGTGLTGAIELRSMQDYADRAGARVTYGAAYDALRCYFEEGGVHAYLARVVGAAATVGTHNLVDRAGAPSTPSPSTPRTPAPGRPTSPSRSPPAAVAGTFRLIIRYTGAGGPAPETYDNLATVADAVTALRGQRVRPRPRPRLATAAPTTSRPSSPHRPVRRHRRPRHHRRRRLHRRPRPVRQEPRPRRRRHPRPNHLPTSAPPSGPRRRTPGAPPSWPPRRARPTTPRHRRSSGPARQPRQPKPPASSTPG